MLPTQETVDIDKASMDANRAGLPMQIKRVLGPSQSTNAAKTQLPPSARTPVSILVQIDVDRVGEVASVFFTFLLQ